MTNKEIIEMLMTQKSQIDGHIARIMAKDELEAPVDPYAELKKAHKAGKRIAIKSCEDGWVYWSNPDWSSPAEDYKIIDDESYICTYWNHFLAGNVQIKYTKCALTGEITTEVVK